MKKISIENLKNPRMNNLYRINNLKKKWKDKYKIINLKCQNL